MKPKYINRLQLCTEEIIYLLLDNVYSDGDKISIVINIIYAEAIKKSEFKILCGGREYNPFAEIEGTDIEDNLGLTILQNVAQDLNHNYADGVNKISFRL